MLVALVAGARADPWQLLDSGAEDVVAVASEQAVGHLLARLERWAAVDAIVESDAVRSVALGAALGVEGGAAGGRRDSPVHHLLDAADRRDRHRKGGRGPSGPRPRPTAAAPRAGSRRLHHDRSVPVGQRVLRTRKGAFTGASTPRSGRFRAGRPRHALPRRGGRAAGRAAGGVVRVVQEGPTSRWAATRWQKTSFRMLAATNRDLWADSEAGRFRRDLYFRLASVTVRLPPLRERRRTSSLLFGHFSRGPARRDASVLDRRWSTCSGARLPGNVRDLSQLAVAGGDPARRRRADQPRRHPARRPAERVVRSRVVRAADVGAAGPGPPGPDSWRQQLERAIRMSLRAGLGSRSSRRWCRRSPPDRAGRERGPAAGGPDAGRQPPRAGLPEVGRRQPALQAAGPARPYSS